MADTYHLDLDRRMLKGATLALTPGDPDRCAAIARHMVELFGGSCSMLAAKREFTTYIVTIGKNKNVIVTSTGIGGPSASIAVDELAQLGIKTFIRVGTTGAIQSYIKTGDCVITTGSVRFDGASTHYAPIEYPAVADHRVVSALMAAAMVSGVRYHVGITASSDTFYPGEERSDSFRKYKMRRFRGLTEEMRALNVLNFEMESATVLTLTASMGLAGGCVTGVVNRGSTGRVTRDSLKLGSENAIDVAVRCAGLLSGL